MLRRASKLVMDSNATDKIEFDTLYAKVIAGMPEAMPAVFVL